MEAYRRSWVRLMRACNTEVLSIFGTKRCAELDAIKTKQQKTKGKNGKALN
jgi:hypothetical protein